MNSNYIKESTLLFQDTHFQRSNLITMVGKAGRLDEKKGF